MSRKNNIDDIFRDKLRNFQETPPASVWDKISEEVSAGRKKKKLIPVFWRYAAGIIIILGIGASWLFFNQTSDLTENLVTGNQLKTDKPGQEKEHNIVAEKKIEPEESSTRKKSTAAVTKPKELTVIAQHSGENIKEKIAEPGDKEDKLQMSDDLAVKYELSTGYTIVSAPISDLPVQIEPGKVKPESAFEENKQPAKTYSWEDLGISLGKEETLKEKRKFTLAAVVSPVYSYRDLNQVSSSLNEYFNQSESGKINFSGGLNVGYAASKRLSIHSGLMYSRIGLGINDIFTLAEYRQPETDELVSNRNASSNYLVNNSIGSIEANNNSRAKFDNSISNEQSPSGELSNDIDYLNAEGFYAPADNYIPDNGTMDQYFQYLEVPLLFKYKIIDRKIDFNLLGGISTNFLVGNKVIYNQGQTSEIIGNTENVRTINYSGNLGLGLDYNIADRFHLLFEPQFKYYMNSINTDNLIGNRPYTLGLYSGFIYLF